MTTELPPPPIKATRSSRASSASRRAAPWTPRSRHSPITRSRRHNFLLAKQARTASRRTQTAVGAVVSGARTRRAVCAATASRSDQTRAVPSWPPVATYPLQPPRHRTCLPAWPRSVATRAPSPARHTMAVPSCEPETTYASTATAHQQRAAWPTPVQTFSSASPLIRQRVTRRSSDVDRTSSPAQAIEVITPPCASSRPTLSTTIRPKASPPHAFTNSPATRSAPHRSSPLVCRAAVAPRRASVAASRRSTAPADVSVATSSLDANAAATQRVSVAIVVTASPRATPTASTPQASRAPSSLQARPWTRHGSSVRVRWSLPEFASYVWRRP
mmetsp:Transcript_1856/g.5246  ORF Transcript_1856/g.5246 Transcript_1856/m.5246 type:complete len:331 (-) Transcript_1856:328-1320(-)